MMLNKKKFDGVTLLEMLLVLVIISSIILMVITYTNTKTDESKRDVTAMRYEQILNAGLAYYINNSAWPTDIGVLKTNNYLPNKPIKNAWGQDFVFYQNSTSGTFSVCSSVLGRQLGSSYTSTTQAGIIAGRLPMAYVAPGPCPATATPPPSAVCASTNCAVISTVNIPGQNLNNARSVNFAGLYHNGGCVPAPVCPSSSMKPAIMVVPVSVSGTYFGNTEVYPLSSFTAYAVGSPTNVGTTIKGDPVATPGACTSAAPSSTVACSITGSTGPGIYWRVCLDVVTENGRISGSNWKASSGTIMAITRCVPTGEPLGSDFNVFQSY
jgi:type II secretory pathway pseudopilin PulG